MKLKSFGCSFIFGTDLADDGRHIETTNGQIAPFALPSRYSYPALIAEHLGLEYSCHARPGASNFEVLNRVLEELATGEPMICLINWTWIERFGFIDENSAWRNYKYNPLGWASILPVDKNKNSVYYYQNLHSQLRDKIETLTCIKSAIDNLKLTNCQFIMTWIDSLIWETAWHCPPSVAWLQQQIKPFLVDFEGQSFLQWSSHKGFSISASQHPLEDAHAAAANFLLSQWHSSLRQ